MTHEEALRIAIEILRERGLNDVADELDTCQCQEDFTDGTAYCQQCGRKAKNSI